MEWKQREVCGTGFQPGQARSAAVLPPLRLLLLHHQFPILHSHRANIIGKLQPIALLGQFLLQSRIHQRYRHTQVADLEFRRIECGVAILLAKMSRDRNPHVLARNLHEELAMHEIAVEADLLVFDDGRSAAVASRKTRADIA